MSAILLRYSSERFWSALLKYCPLYFIRQRGMPSEDTSNHPLPSILVSYRALSRLANSFCIIIRLCESSSLSTKGKRRFYICVLVQRKIAVWVAKKPDIIGLFAEDIFFVSTLWRRRRDSNSRAGCPTYALSRGASSPT